MGRTSLPTIVYFGLFALLLGFISLWQTNQTVAAAKSDFYISNTTNLPLQLPSGFSVSYFAKNLNHPTAMTWDESGNMLVLEQSKGQVVSLKDDNRDGIADKKTTLIKDLKNPEALALKCGTSDTFYLEGTLRELQAVQGEVSCLLYVRENKNIVTYDYDSKLSKAFYAGDIPLDNTNKAGLFGRVAQAQDEIDSCEDNQPIESLCLDPSETFFGLAQKHMSPQMVLVPENGWPIEYRGNVLVAYPGTDEQLSGYKIVRYKYDTEGVYVGQEDFISGWLSEGQVTGSPTALLIGPSQSSYITDLYIADADGTILRAVYRGQAFGRHKRVLIDRLE